MIKNFVQRVLLSILLLTPFSVFALSDTTITVINETESIPDNLQPLSQQVFTGDDPAGDCSYFELMEKAKITARTLGANVVKINKRKERSQKVYCDELQVSFFKVDDISPLEKRFSWTTDRKLKWDDFKGNVPGGASNKTAAETSCGIAIETNTVNSRNPVKVYVFNTFLTSTSWVRTANKKDHILEHEQCHFYICELYTRKMRERFSKAKMNVQNMQSVIRNIYNSTMNDYAARQQAYEQETQHGIVEDAQQRWMKKIAEELAETESWSSR